MTGRLYRSAIWLGGTALLAAALIDIASVLARNLMTSVHGSIELIQVAILKFAGEVIGIRLHVEVPIAR